MSGNPFEKVTSGSDLSIAADAWNPLLDLARERAGNRRGAGIATPDRRRTSMVMVKNASGAAVGQFAVLGIDTLVITPTDNADDFKDSPILSCITPTVAAHTGKFVIASEPIPSGEFGFAFIEEVCPVQINIVDTSHAFADVKDSDATQLQSGVTGAAQILWSESGTGSKWAVVRLGNAPPTGVPGTITASSGGPVQWNYTAGTYSGITLAVVRNGMEPVNGSPGKLGINVGTSGITTSGCTIKAIGNGSAVMFFPDPTVPGGWFFTAANSAE